MDILGGGCSGKGVLRGWVELSSVQKSRSPSLASHVSLLSPLSTLALREVLAQRIASLAMDQLLTVWLPLADEAAGGGAAVPPLGRDGPVGGTGGTSGDPAGTGRSEEAGYSGWPAGGDRMEREGWREMMIRWGFDEGEGSSASEGTTTTTTTVATERGGPPRPDLATATRRLLLQKALAAEQHSQRGGGGDGMAERGWLRGDG